MKPHQAVRVVSLVILASSALTAQSARKVDVPLKNWVTPLYWHPTGSALPQLQVSASQVSPDALTFIAITPCRLVDTRGVGGSFNGMTPFSGPSIASGATVTFPVQSTTEASADTTPAPCGVIPSIAEAYSFNVTVVPHSGGAVDYISLWPAGGTQPFVATLNDPQGAIAGNAAIVPAGTPMGGVNFYNSGPATMDVIIDMNGFFTAPSDLNGNTAIGAAALGSNNSGTNNTAVGASALTSNTTGFHDTAVGTGTLAANTTGSANTAVGNEALESNTTGGSNTAVGGLSLASNTTGNNNTAIGQQALVSNTTGSNNTATGQFALNVNTTGSNNTADGQNALEVNSTGIANTALGAAALAANTTGAFNTASGYSALTSNTTGNVNTAMGEAALASNTTGIQNSAIGDGALGTNTTGNYNSAIGVSALGNSTTGNNNTASGNSALFFTTTGGNNIAIGYKAAYNLIGGDSNNIHIGHQGLASDGAAVNSGVIRIGTQATQTSTFIAGISGATPGTPNLTVCVDGNGQLGTVCTGGAPSSLRFKDQIADMGDGSSKLLQLRPVTFFYKPQYDDGSHSLQYGLIAEEVAKLYPEMVGYDKDGLPASVKYQSLAPMLLNEVQKQAAQLQRQQRLNLEQAEQMRLLQERLAALEAVLAGQTPAVAKPAGPQ